MGNFFDPHLVRYVDVWIAHVSVISIYVIYNFIIFIYKMIIFYNAVTVSKIFIPAGHEREQRPQPTHPAIFDLSGMYRNL